MALERRGANSMSVLVLLCLWLSVGCRHTNAQRPPPQRQEQTSCQLKRLNAQEPSQTIRSEGGVTELSTRHDNDELDCAGVDFLRETIETDCLSLPRYSNVPKLAFITEGQGRLGVIFPGCPESFRRSPFGEEEEGECERRSRGERQGGREEEREAERGESEVERLSRRERERAREESSQKVRRVQRGDVIAIPAGTAYWLYNDGDTRLRIVAVADSSSNQNQLDKRYRPFYLAGSSETRERRSGERREGEEQEEERTLGGNILAGFDPNMLAEAWGVNTETVRNVQESNQGRGLIIRIERQRQTPPDEVYNSLNMILSGGESDPNPGGNLGIEESFCSMRLRHNVDRADDADVYIRDGGRLNVVNRFKLHALAHLDLAAERGVLRPRAMLAPSWHACHSIMYATRGSARIQVVENRGRRVFDGNVREGQFIVIPQMYAAVKRAGEQGFEWITFTTCDSPMRSSFAGRNSVLKAMPQEVVANAFNITCSEARNLRWNREHEDVIMPPLRRAQRN